MKPIITSRSLHALSTLVVAGVLSWSSQAHAQTIYSDDFSSGANGDFIRGKTPTVDLTGATYLGASRGSGNPTYNTATGNPGPSALTNFNGSDALSLATGGAFTRSAAPTFTISAALAVNTTTGSGGITGPQPTGGNSTRGVGLGFYSAFTDGATGQDPFPVAYTGFNLQNNGTSGLLQLVVGGVSSGFASATVLSGTFSTTAFYNLTYTVNTSTGNLTSLIFNGTDLTSTFATSAAGAFTTAQTAYAGFGASSSTVQTGSYVDNFSVSVVPEPGTWAASLIGIVTLLVVVRFRARKA